MQDPPNLRSGPRDPFWVEVVETICKQENHGEWAYIGLHSPGTPQQIKAGRYPAFCPNPDADFTERIDYIAGRYEFRTAMQEEAESDGTTRRRLYVRYLGE